MDFHYYVSLMITLRTFKIQISTEPLNLFDFVKLVCIYHSGADLPWNDLRACFFHI
jgi:hypothetical protein